MPDQPSEQQVEEALTAARKWESDFYGPSHDARFKVGHVRTLAAAVRERTAERDAWQESSYAHERRENIEHERVHQLEDRIAALTAERDELGQTYEELRDGTRETIAALTADNQRLREQRDELIQAAKAFITTTSVFQQRRVSRDAFTRLSVAAHWPSDARATLNPTEQA